MAVQYSFVMKGLTKTFPGANKPLFNDIHLQFLPGTKIAIIGVNGAGKSTLMKMVAGVERPTSGKVIVSGHDVGRIKPAGIPFLRRNIGIIFQQQRLLNDRNILANTMLPMLVTGARTAEAEQRARAALDKVGLLDRARAMPLELSGGEQQRVAVARAIVNRPQIILADEPTANLDRVAADKVLDALRSFHAVGVTCVISTHDDYVLERAERVIRLENGQLVGGAA